MGNRLLREVEFFILFCIALGFIATVLVAIGRGF